MTVFLGSLLHYLIYFVGSQHPLLLTASNSLLELYARIFLRISWQASRTEDNLVICILHSKVDVGLCLYVGLVCQFFYCLIVIEIFQTYQDLD